MIVRHFRRAWLCAALAVFLGAGCATVDLIDGDGDDKVRVQVEWRLDLASDRIGEIEARELGRPVLSPGGDLLVGASNGWVYRIDAGGGDIKWGTPIDGSIDARAELVSNVVYVGTDDGQVVALGWREGEVLWRFETRGSVETTPTVTGGRLFVPDSDDVLYALDAVTGELLWDYQRQTPEFFTIKGGGEPLVVGNTVYAGFSDGHLVALHADSGDEIWAAYLGDESGEFGDVSLPIAIDDERLIVSSHAGGVYLVERATGALLWRADITEVTAGEFVGGWLFLSTAGGRVIALDTRDGEIGWEYNTPNDRPAMDLRLVAPYVAVATVDGPLIWLRLRDGEPMAKWAPSTGFQSAPVFDERYGYVISNQGYLYGFRLAF